MPERNNDHLLFLFWLLATAVLCGAAVMVVEIMGSRVIGPFFGVSLFVWTSLISVTLIALALGYALGGILADRKGSPDYLYGIILIAGFLILLIPLSKGIFLKAFQPIGLRSGALLSATLLFGPSLFVLGFVSPYIVRIGAREIKNIGRTVGIFYAVSTVGSFLGPIVVGFFLIGYLGVSRIFWVTGFMLIGISVLYFLLFRKKWYSLLMLLPPLLMLHSGIPPSKTMPNGTKVSMVSSRDSFYGNLKVVDYSYGPVRTRELMIDGLVQGGIDLDTLMPIYNYFYFLEFIPYSLNPSGRNCLVIGLGAGIIPMWYEQRGVTTDIIDIDPLVIEIARDYFGFRSGGDVYISDARYFLATSQKKYDFIIMDVFNGDTTPGYLLSVEALRLLKKRMTERGILAINLIGSLREKDSFITSSVVKTLSKVFETAEIYPAFTVDQGDRKGDMAGNLALIAYDAPPIPFNQDMVKYFPVHPFVGGPVRQSMGKTFSFASRSDAIVLSDDYNPVDFYDRRLKEDLRKDILKSIDTDILMW